MTKRSPAMRTSSLLGNVATIGRSMPPRGSMDGLRLVDVRLHALEVRPASAIPAAILAAVDDARQVHAITKDRLVFLDELPNAAVTLGWHDEDGLFHPPIGEAGVEAMRRLFRDRKLDGGHRLSS